MSPAASARLRFAVWRDDTRGAVAMIYALVFIAVMVALGVGVDLSNTLQLKYRLDLAADAAAVACGEAWQADMTSGVTTLVANAVTDATNFGTTSFQAQAGATGQGVTPTVGTQVGVGGNGGPQLTCSISYNASNATYIMRIVGFTTLQISGNSQSLVNLSPYANVYFILDTSASMMVGSTTADSLLIANWLKNNYGMSVTDWYQNNGVTTYGSTALQSATEQPCSFACHENEGAQSSYGVNLGVTNAKLAGATTRFDVMLAALTNDPLYTTDPTDAYSSSYNSTLGEGLLPYIRDQYLSTNARANLNTFSYYMYGFNEGINHSNPSTVSGDNSQNSITAQTNLQKVAAAIAGSTTLGVTGLNLGFSTHFNPGNPTDAAVSGSATCTTTAKPYLLESDLASSPEYNMAAGCFVGPQLVRLVGSVGASAGASAANPKKFVILVTDGVNSDVEWNYGGAQPNPGLGVTYTSLANACGVWTTECTAHGNVPIFGSVSGITNYAWNGFNNYGYGGPFDTAYCTALKNSGVTVGVLETPYVPLYGQNPGNASSSGGFASAYPYEATVQEALYPGGPNSTSAASTALQNCATSAAYYYKVTSDATLSKGFVTLFDQFVGQWVHVTK